ncbi:MAG: haloacid dehalogenase-like hydrolase [Myxococcota bacterium]
MIALLLALAAMPPQNLAQSACWPEGALSMSRSVELPKLRWSDEAHKRLSELIARRGAKAAGYDRCHRPLAVLDFDNTTIQGDLGDAAFAEAAARGMLIHAPELIALLPDSAKGLLDGPWKSGAPDTAGRLVLAYEALLKDQGPRAAYPWLTQAFHGNKIEDLRVFAQELADGELGRPLGPAPLPGPEGPISAARGIRLRPEISSLIDALTKSGFDVFIVTASPEWLVSTFAPRIGLWPENVVGMRTTETSTLGVELEPPVTYRMGKVTAIRTRIAPGGRRPVLALGDSLGDREMLEDATDLAVLIDRGDTDLAALAKSRGMVVQHAFEGTVEPPVADKPRPPARPRRR